MSKEERKGRLQVDIPIAGERPVHNQVGERRVDGSLSLLHKMADACRYPRRLVPTVALVRYPWAQGGSKTSLHALARS